ncbi:MAG: zeta toxin family protein [Sediminibacterium sp. Gen4]|uniref:zeta toxin family protein n=1 Tax=unclassified Sediminibacterium TaxID=2635961 RepID=UPI0015BB1A36|nr:zeta toxin family protein [Sediminibacterium sp.]MBW0160166.1 zeta toxin family protein [Sediminibacterium sp.]MBW0164697.1 zeta toxin family protein [Sediminibacterium sp.]NWK65985.1 zeta toxin family protein [Sediminibacterium sp. Gen4]
MPNLYIIAGCNGAGKTTASFTILPEILDCKEFVNADEIAKGLSPFQPENVSFQAGRLMLERVDELLNNRSDFAFETTLTTLSYLNTIKEAKVKGYSITLLFFWLDNVTLAIERVKTRVREGGHNIPEETIKRRYIRGIKNLISKFTAVCDYWLVINNSSRPFTFIAEGQGANETKIYDIPVWELIKQQSNEKE